MRSVLSVLLLVSLVVACGAPDSPPAATEEPAPPPEPQGQYGWLPAPEDSTRRAGTLGDAEHAHHVVAVLTEWGIELDPDTIEAGEVSIALQNHGEQSHAIEVRSIRAGRWRSLPIPPGGTVTMTMPMAPANFEVVSTEDGHVERGMRALLIVR